MFVALKDNRRYVLRFDKGEEVLAKLQEFMTQEKVNACVFWGIGSCSEIELGYYNAHLKDYRKKPYYEELELVTLHGNGSLMDGKPAIHAHGEFGRTDFTLLGGHVFKIVTNATVEIFLIQLDGNLQRKNNPDFNLNLLT